MVEAGSGCGADGHREEPTTLISTCNIHGGQRPTPTAGDRCSCGMQPQLPALSPAGGTGLLASAEHEESSAAAEACRHA